MCLLKTFKRLAGDVFYVAFKGVSSILVAHDTVKEALIGTNPPTENKIIKFGVHTKPITKHTKE